MKNIKTYLTFVGDKSGKAKEAIDFYTTLFNDAEIRDITYWKEGEAGGEAGQVKMAHFTIGEKEYIASENTGAHEWTFTPAISIFVECESGAEIARLHEALADGGKELMRLNEYEFAKRFSWVEDRFGITWQLNLK